MYNYSVFSNNVSWDYPFLIKYSWLFYNISWYYVFRGILFCSAWLVCLFFCQYSSVLITIALQYYCSYVVWNVMPPMFFFFLRLLWIFGNFCGFRQIWGSLFVLLCKKCHWTFDRDSIKSIDDFGYCEHFNNINQLILIYQIINQLINYMYMSNLSIYLCFQFFSFKCYSFHCMGLPVPWLHLFLSILLFDAK